jgi:hypothetical protein
MSVKKWIEVAVKPSNMRLNPARNFPKTNSYVFKGNVDIISMVPILFSLAMRPIETAGIKKRYTSGTMSNNVRKSDWPNKKKVLVKKYPFTTANITRKIYAMGLLKNPSISLRKTILILNIYTPICG